MHSAFGCFHTREEWDKEVWNIWLVLINSVNNFEYVGASSFVKLACSTQYATLPSIHDSISTITADTNNSIGSNFYYIKRFLLMNTMIIIIYDVAKLQQTDV